MQQTLLPQTQSQLVRSDSEIARREKRDKRDEQAALFTQAQTQAPSREWRGASGEQMALPPHTQAQSEFARSDVALSTLEVLEFLEKRKNLLDSIVITGGEPTLWGKELKKWLKVIRSFGYRIKFDSNGTNPSFLKEIIDEHLIDAIAMDIKTSFDQYQKITQFPVNVERIKQSISIIVSSGIEYDFRTTIHSNLHTKHEIKTMITELKQLGVTKYSLQFFVDSGSLLGNPGEDTYRKEKEYFKQLLEENFKEYRIRNE
jgi:pyruvate formate lyase activating enzyme